MRSKPLNNLDNTANYYNERTQDFVERTLYLDMQSLYQPFLAELAKVSPDQHHILDLGCGSGRDSLYFTNLGFKVTAIDASQKLLELAKENSHQQSLQQSDIDWQCLNFYDLDNRNWTSSYTGIWACASLLHVPYKELPAMISTLIPMLIKGGVFYASFKYGNSERVEDKRFFCDMNEQRWDNLKTAINYKFNDSVWLTTHQRVDKTITWFNVLIKF